MLRIAVISLLVANLLLLGFQGSKPTTQPETITKQTAVEDSSVPTIHLFSEMMQDQDLISGNRRCFSLGPFHSSEEKNEIRALLEDVSANISERETQALVEKGYWVYMPPYESLLEANQVLLSLQALGLKDIGVIYNGDWQNAISLGYFLRQKNALKRKKDLEDRNFTPMIRVQRQSESRYWLDYEQSPGSGLVAMDMQDRPNDFLQRAVPCLEQEPFETTAVVAENLAVETKQPQTETEPENGLEAEQKNGKEIELEASEYPVDDTLQQQTATPEEGDGPQPTSDDGVDPEVSIDSTPVDSDKAVSNQIIVTEPESDPEGGDALQPIDDDAINAAESIDSTPVDSENSAPESAIETEPENSVGTGPVIDFGTEPEDSDETEIDGG
jgi:hypothetical protein